MSDLKAITCPYPSCQHEWHPPKPDPTRCEKCFRTLKGSAPGRAQAEAAGKQRVRPNVKRVSRASSLKSTKKPGVKAAVAPARMTARESCAAARRAMHQEPDNLPWPDSCHRWNLNVGMD